MSCSSGTCGLTNKAPKGYSAFSTLNPMQQQLFGQVGPRGKFAIENSPLFQQGSNYLQELLGGGQQAYQNFAAPYMRQFQEQVIPNLARLYAGAGAGSSSSFQKALGQAGAGLQEQLAALREGLRFNALPQALSFAGAPGAQKQGLLGINTQALVQKQPSFLQSLGLSLAGGFGQGLGGLLGGFL